MNLEKFVSFEHSKQEFYLLHKWSDNSAKYLSLVLTDCTNYWNGEFSKKEVENASNLNEFKIEDIPKQIDRAFSSRTKSEYLIKLSNDLVEKNISIKKLVDDIQIEIISLKLKVVDDPEKYIKSIYKHSIKNFSRLEERISDLELDLKRFSDERREGFEKLAQCIKEKDDLETELFSKFIAILNEKKKKIRELSSHSGGAGVEEDEDVDVE